MIRRGQARFGVLALWSGALLAAAAGHAAVAAITLNWAASETAPEGAPPVITIDLQPPTAPSIPEQQVAPGPQAADSVPQPQSAPPEKVTNSEADLPPLPEKPEAVAMLPPPMPEARPETRPTPRDAPDQVKRQERKKERKVASRAAAPATFEAQRSPSATAPAAGTTRIPTAAMASWKNELMAQLNRHKHYPSGTDRSGTAMVAFSMNHSGEVTSVRLVHSSGNNALDDEAVALPRRASPLPKPPEGIPMGSLTLTVPVRFGRN